MKKVSLTENWEQELLLQFYKPASGRQSAYICSPLHAEGYEHFLNNMYAARFYMYYVQHYLGYLARAPHAYLPLLVNDYNLLERELVFSFDLDLLEYSDKVLVCGERLSHGMAAEINYAVDHHKQIEVFHPALYEKIKDIVEKRSEGYDSLEWNNAHPLLGCLWPQILAGNREGGDCHEELLLPR